MGGSELFDPFAADYDRFFAERPDVFQSELAAMRSLKLEGRGLDVGVGTGAFAQHVTGIVGVDVARGMLERARERGIACLQASAENLPFRSEVFDFVIMSTVLCFLRSPQGALMEARRTLRPGGMMAICMIPRGSGWGRLYAQKGRRGHPLYSHARFLSPREVETLLGRAGLQVESCVSTLHRPPEGGPETPEPVLQDDRGSFVCLLARKGLRAPAARPRAPPRA